MKTLIVEDDFTSRTLLQELLRNHGPSHVAVNGREAVEAVRMALEGGEAYDLICLDILMPDMDGQETLRAIRSLEERFGHFAGHGAKIIMTTALQDKENVLQAFREQCDGYIVKPIGKAKLFNYLHQFGLLGTSPGGVSSV